MGPIDADIHVVQNSLKTIVSGQISDDKSPLSFTLMLNVAAGDTIDFAVGNGGTGKPTFDSTGLKGEITLEPCARCE